MSRARKLRPLSCLLGLVALAWLAGCAARRSLGRTTPLALAQDAHAQWIARPDDVSASRNFYRSVARLLEWFDALPVARRTETCRDAGLAVEMDTMEEGGLYRFAVADKVPAHRLLRRHIRSGIGVPVVAWRPNDGSDQWDAFRPPEGIAAPATAMLERENRVRRAILIAVPHRGSRIADNWIGDLGQSLYRADTDLQEAFRTLVENPLPSGSNIPESLGRGSGR